MDASAITNTMKDYCIRRKRIKMLEEIPKCPPPGRFFGYLTSRLGISCSNLIFLKICQFDFQKQEAVVAPKDIGSVLENINAWVWGPWTFFLFIGTGIFLTVRLKLLPWKNLGFSLRQVCSDIIHPRKGDGKNISPFQSLMTAMAAMMGTGNIAGVAAAMVLGGPAH